VLAGDVSQRSEGPNEHLLAVGALHVAVAVAGVDIGHDDDRRGVVDDLLQAAYQRGVFIGLERASDLNPVEDAAIRCNLDERFGRRVVAGAQPDTSPPSSRSLSTASVCKTSRGSSSHWTRVSPSSSVGSSGISIDDPSVGGSAESILWHLNVEVLGVV